MGYSQLQVSVVLPMQMPAEISEWQTNPTLVQVIITSLPGTPEYSSARCEFVIRNIDNQSVVVSTKTKHPALPRFPISIGPSTQIRYGRDIIQGSSLFINQQYESTFISTNSIPEGNYEFCLEIYDDISNQLIYSSTQQGICSPFIVIVPDPPSLLIPTDLEKVSSNFPIFTWTPVLIADGSLVRYNLKIVPVFEGQNARFALDYNETLTEIKEILSTSYLYSPAERLFSVYPQAVGFAWQVQAMTSQGKPATRNNGKSELFMFSFLKDTSSTSVTDNFPDDLEIVTTPYEVRKNRSIQFGEFWVTLTKEIECETCTINEKGFVFIPFLNDSFPVTLQNVSISRTNNTAYSALSGIASSSNEVVSTRKNAITIELSTLKLTPESATANLKATLNWLPTGWMSGENSSTFTAVQMIPSGIRQSLKLEIPWNREGNQIGLNNSFSVKVDSLHIAIHSSKFDVEGSASFCPSKNLSMVGNAEFDCTSSRVKLAEERISFIQENLSTPIIITTNQSTFNAIGFTVDLSTISSSTIGENSNEWIGIQLLDANGEFLVKPPFGNIVPLKVTSKSVDVQTTSNSFVHSGSFQIDSFSCSYGGFPLNMLPSKFTLSQNQSSSKSIDGTISVLELNKPTTWTDFEKIPVEIILDNTFTLHTAIGSTQKESSVVATLPLEFQGVTDKLTLELSGAAINVVSVSEAVLSFSQSNIKNNTRKVDLQIDPIQIKSNSNKFGFSTPKSNISAENDFSINGAEFIVTKATFQYSSPKEYSLSSSGFLKGIGNLMPKTLKGVPFSNLTIRSNGVPTSQEESFLFSIPNTISSFGKTRFISEEFEGKSFFGFKGSATTSSDGLLPFEQQKSTFYIGSLNGTPVWIVSNSLTQNKTDETLLIQNVESRKATINQYISDKTQNNSLKSISTFGSFGIETLKFFFGNLDSDSPTLDFSGSVYFEARSLQKNTSSLKMAGLLYRKSDKTVSFDGAHQLGERGTFVLNKLTTISSSGSNPQFVVEGYGDFLLSPQSTSKARIKIENQNNQSSIELKEISGLFSHSESDPVSLIQSSSEFLFQNASFVLNEYGIEATNGVTFSSIMGKDGKDKGFLAVQNKASTTFLFDINSINGFYTKSDVTGTIIASYDDDPCTQWGTLKGISPNEALKSNIKDASIATFSVGEISDCGTSLSAKQQGTYSLCISTSKNQLLCPTPTTLFAKTSSINYSMGSCDECMQFEKSIQNSSKKLVNPNPKLVVVDQYPKKGTINADPTLPIDFRYSVSQVKKTNTNITVPGVVLEFKENENAQFEVDSLSFNIYSVVNGNEVALKSQLMYQFTICTEYRSIFNIVLRNTKTTEKIVLADTTQWRTSTFSKTQVASSKVVFEPSDASSRVRVITSPDGKPNSSNTSLMQNLTFFRSDIVSKESIIPNNIIAGSIQLASTVSKKTEITAIPLSTYCETEPMLGITAYPKILNGMIQSLQLENNQVILEALNIPEGIEFTVEVNNFCNNEPVNSVSKTFYSESPNSENKILQHIFLESIVGSFKNVCPQNGYTITISFPSQFKIESKCLKVGVAPECTSLRRE